MRAGVAVPDRRWRAGPITHLWSRPAVRHCDDNGGVELAESVKGLVSVGQPTGKIDGEAATGPYRPGSPSWISRATPSRSRRYRQSCRRRRLPLPKSQRRRRRP